MQLHQGRRVYPALPYITFAVVNVVVGVLCLLLPETRNTPFPATIQDAVDLEKYIRYNAVYQLVVLMISNNLC